ncbi:alpha/beta hydrolase family protein [Pedobacter sp.]|jgi:dipeptidyl aminopeptidase/acylaminoacyl peptidase|uniref:alpha/beta hydrolase family protein n=1 Tax=Pedobacter sp. TaxID=1411316 RepID=UPI002B933F0A|nr:prolyl oligopeptidase family serine peptidase [Pedobacter sp.]HWW42272.1 prolyl oligopeptidase family serine peptidase [Pedobacter sp.]
MKRFFLMVLFSWGVQSIFAQKPVIDSAVYDKWPIIGLGAVISNDGKYIVYNVEKGPSDRTGLVIQSTQTKWTMKFPFDIILGPKITEDSKYCFFITQNNILNIIDFADNSVTRIPNVSNFSVAESKPVLRFAYQINDFKRTLVIRNFITGREVTYLNVSWYNLSNDGKFLIINRSSERDNRHQYLEWVNLATNRTISIYDGGEMDNIVLDLKHRQLAFKVSNSIWYCKVGISKPTCLVKSEGLGNSFGYLNRFSEDGRYLYCEIKKDIFPTSTKSETPVVQVWSYRDVKLPSEQEKVKSSKIYGAIIRLNDCKIIPLQLYDDEFFLSDSYNKTLLSRHQIKDSSSTGVWWNTKPKVRYELLNSRTGERKQLTFLNNNSSLQSMSFYSIKLSPDQKFIIYYDINEKNFFSYNLKSGEVVNLSKEIRTSWVNIDNNDLQKNSPRGIAGWLPNDRSVLIYDRYDIWKFDPQGKSLPINVTNGYGRRNKIIFSLINFEQFSTDINIVREKDKLILSAFNTVDKNNGFFSGRVDRCNDPVKLTMGPYIYKINSGNIPFNVYDFSPLKAKEAENYIVRRMSVNEAPNYFSTRDFRSFNKLTDFNPHNDYNWYTTELHSWKSFDGRTLQGVLYKPENFDPNKKYPVIFYYYQKLSDGLNAYLEPEYSYGALDIPSYVSNGYLVFCPDIYYSIGDPMQGTYDAVVSSAEYLSKLPFVNSRKMGIQGHSWGAIQTNYLVTQTNLFVAACSSSGVGDWISKSGTLRGNPTIGYSNSLSEDFELGQSRMGTALSENLAGYIKNSPVLHINKVITPLLIMQTKNDPACPYPNTLELFLELRRLGKKAWMLVYPKGNHVLNGDESKDFTIRMQQFFDHYLKDKPAPAWMLDGTSETGRREDSGLKLDSTGRIPGTGLLTLEEQRKVDSLMTRKPITITLK